MPRKVLSALRMAGYVATRVYDAGLRSQPDVAIFTYARAHQMTIITFDTDYLNQAAFPLPHAGILVLRPLVPEESLCERASFCYPKSSGTISWP
jgi:predicted nuclease of predicted toxin-antitoxin system